MFERITRNISGRTVDFITVDKPRRKPAVSEQEDNMRRHLAFTALAQCVERTDSACVTDVREYRYVHGSTRYEADVDYMTAEGKTVRYTMNVAIIPSDLGHVGMER